MTETAAVMSCSSGQADGDSACAGGGRDRDDDGDDSDDTGGRHEMQWCTSRKVSRGLRVDSEMTKTIVLTCHSCCVEDCCGVCARKFENEFATAVRVVPHVANGPQRNELKTMRWPLSPSALQLNHDPHWASERENLSNWRACSLDVSELTRAHDVRFSHWQPSGHALACLDPLRFSWPPVVYNGHIPSLGSGGVTEIACLLLGRSTTLHM